MTDVILIAGPPILVALICIPVFVWTARRERQARRDRLAGRRR